MQAPRSALVAAVELPEALERIRLDHVDNARLGVPAHVTLLFPFVPARELTPSDVARAAAVVARSSAFDVDFRRAETFTATPVKESVVWLAPEPPGPFISLTEALAAAFPAYPPYEGIHDTVIPHLTLANARVDVAAIMKICDAQLPFTRPVDEVALLVEDDAGQWRTARELRLA